MTQHAFPSRAGEFDGMTLRDYFAGQALSALISELHRLSGDFDYESSAIIAYAFADAMIAEKKDLEENAS